MKWLTILLFGFISAAHASEPSNFSSEDLKSEASVYAHAAGLPPLTSTADFELRIWTRDYMSGSVTGVVVSNGTRRSFESTSMYKEGKVVVKAADLGREKPIGNLSQLKRLVTGLKAYNGNAVSCDVMDGESDLVDAVVQGHAATVKVDNPGSCADKASQIVVKLLDGLRD
jgi:hypothetical protein